MKLLLTAISGSHEGQTFTIEPNQSITFGRTAASAVSFEDDGHMSSVHFEVQNLGTHSEVRDLGSTNGTWLNEQKVMTEQLRDGDRLRAGKTVLTVEILRAAASDTTPSASDLSMTWAPAVLPPDSYPTPPDRAQDWGPSTESQPSEFPPKRSPESREPELHESRPIREPASPLPPLRPSSQPSKRPSNPFDSIDFGDSPFTHQPLDNDSPSGSPIRFADPPASHPREVSNPFDDSSASFPFSPLSPSRSAPAEERPRSSFAFLNRRTTGDAADAFAVILDSLAQRWSVQVVVHFQKIRSSPPGNCPGKPLFPWLVGTQAAEYSPLRLGWNEIQAEPSILALLPRLCRADACVAFLGESSLEVSQQIDKMLSVGLEPFSEPDGFLPAYWPSSLATILEVQTPSGCEVLFGQRISGAMMCSIWNRKALLAAAVPDLQRMLGENGFIQSSSLTHLLPD